MALVVVGGVVGLLGYHMKGCKYLISELLLDHGGNVEKVVVMWECLNTLGATIVNEGMNTLLVALSTIGRMFSGVELLLGS